MREVFPIYSEILFNLSSFLQTMKSGSSHLKKPFEHPLKISLPIPQVLEIGSKPVFFNMLKLFK